MKDIKGTLSLRKLAKNAANSLIFGNPMNMFQKSPKSYHNSMQANGLQEHRPSKFAPSGNRTWVTRGAAIYYKNLRKMQPQTLNAFLIFEFHLYGLVTLKPKLIYKTSLEIPDMHLLGLRSSRAQLDFYLSFYWVKEPSNHTIKCKSYPNFCASCILARNTANF